MKTIDNPDYEIRILTLDYREENSKDEVLKHAKDDLAVYKQLGWELDPDDIESIRFDAMVSGQVVPSDLTFMVTFRRRKH
jgi:hypothetical protein